MDDSERRMPTRLDVPQLVLGLTLVGLGILFVLGQADIVSAGTVAQSAWPVVILVYGAIHYLTSRQRVASLIIMALGTVLLLFSLEVVPGSAFSLIGPLLLIAIGAWILVARQRVAGKDMSATISSVSVFGELEVIRQSQEFAGGTVTAMFSETSVDLRSAALAVEGARIDVLAVFAEVVIRIPPGWRIVMDGIPIFAEYGDKTERVGSIADDAPTLTINLLGLFAEVTVRN